jgi:subtilisin family serine protease
MINYSGGGPEPSREELAILKEAERKGILIVAAAGNERSNIDIRKNAYYPASYGLDNIITVGAINQNANIISSSNWGKNSVDIAAPGFRIKSTVPFSAAGHMTGTSQATAFVTGVAALIKSNYPELSSDQIKNIILASSVKQSNLTGKILGGGRLDAYKALALGKKVVESNQTRKVAKRD